MQKDLTEQFISKFIKKIEVSPVRMKPSTHYRLKNSNSDIRELLMWINKHLDDEYELDLDKLFSIFKDKKQ